ncbi:hypothetical protein [Photobacterium toruni]|uniref:hypothetical protein n=1 Tax=Photobacterium toruni TaxID=1935446 RepID=UPI00210FF603|nr:hypothetical protein [Photobacterium toruni]
MSLEQQIGALVKASENLTGAVNGKIGEIDKEVDAAKVEFEQFRAEADVRYKHRSCVRFFVAGNADQFIPVCIKLAPEPIAKLEIQRSWVRDDANQSGHGSDPGTTAILFEAIASSWGSRTGFTHLITHYHSGIQKLCDYSNPYRMSNLIVWLRGGLHYTLYHDQMNLTSDDVVTVNEEITSWNELVGDNKLVIAARGVSDVSLGAVFPIKTEVNVSIPTQYRLGVSSNV